MSRSLRVVEYLCTNPDCGAGSHPWHPFDVEAMALEDLSEHTVTLRVRTLSKTKDVLQVQHQLRKAKERVRVLEAEEFKLMGVYAVQCKGCRALIGESCKKVSGVRTRPHKERIQTAAAYLATLG